MKNIKTFLFALLAICLAAPSYAQLPPLTTVVEHGTTTQTGYTTITPFNFVCNAPAGYTFHGDVLITEIRWQGEWQVIDEPFNATLSGVPYAASGSASSKNFWFTIKNGSTWPFHADGTVTVKAVYWYGVPYAVQTKTHTNLFILEGHPFYSVLADEIAEVSLPW